MAVLPAGADDSRTLLAAEKYFSTDKAVRFEKQAAKLLKNSDYAPLVRYWQGVLSLRRGQPQAAVAFVENPESPYLRDKMRYALTEFYLKHKNWQAFAQIAQNGGDCARVYAGLLAKSTVADKLLALWYKDKAMRDTVCLDLYRLGKQRGILTDDAVWLKVRALAGAKRLAPVKRVLQKFPGYIKYSAVRKVIRRAERYALSKHGLRTRADRELLMVAISVLARKKPGMAIRRWGQFSRYFSNADNTYMWTVLAEWAARWHRDDALKLYRRGLGDYANDNTRAWRVRAGLRAGDTADVLATIETMPKEQRQISAWRYWRAAMLLRQGDLAAATTEWQALAEDEDDYYGLLAREEIGLPLLKKSPPPPLGEVDGDFKLAVALYRAGLKSLANAIWRHALKDAAATTPRLFAAAKASAAVQWYLASVNAADKIPGTAAHDLRFPLPYQGEIFKNTRSRRLDAAFVYGLIRQESRFMSRIVSSANAQGLMQVIPPTARSVARKHRYTKYRLSRLKRVDTNVILGTTYLADLAERFDAHPAHIAAGYNAGPTRVRRWYRASPALMVAIENIPITETRLYVKYLMENRLHYLARLGKPLPSMRELLTRPIIVN